MPNVDDRDSVLAAINSGAPLVSQPSLDDEPLKRDLAVEGFVSYCITKISEVLCSTPGVTEELRRDVLFALIKRLALINNADCDRDKGKGEN